MRSLSAPRPQVVTVDLRRDLEEVLNAPTVSELQRRRSTQTGWVQLGRLLVLDTAAELTAHQAALERLIREARSVGQVLVVAFGDGRPAVDSSLQLPRVLTETRTPVLWVGHTSAVPWSMGSPYSQEFVVGDDGAPRRLLDTLQVPEIFDYVADAVQASAPPVASPGLHVLDLTTELANATARAQANAVDQLTRVATGPELLAAQAVREGRLGKIVCRRTPPPSLLDPAGPLNRTAAKVRQHLAAADAGARALRRTGLGGTALQKASADAAKALSALRAQTEQTLAATLSDGIGAARATPNVKVSPELAEADRQLAEDLREATAELVRQGRNLPAAAQQLQTLAAAYMPLPLSTLSARLRDACPDHLTTALAAAPPPSAAASVPLCAAAAVSGLLATVSPTAWPLGPALAATSLLLTSLLIWAARPSGGSAGATGWRPYLVSAFAGALVGTLLAAAPWAQAAWWPPVSVAVVMVAVVLPPLTAMAERRRALKRWEAGPSLPEAVEAVSAILAVAADALLNDWLLADEHRARARLLNDIAQVLDAAAARLRSSATLRLQVPSDGSEVDVLGFQDWLSSRERALATLATDDYIAVLERSLGEYWRDLVDTDEATTETPVAEQVAARLDERDSLWAKQGILLTDVAVPELDARRQKLVAELWAQVHGLAATLLISVNDARLVQLCSHEQLPLLSLSPESARVVRFMPAAARHASPDAGALLCSTSSMTGVIRLVPLRDRVIHLTERASPDTEVSLTGGSYRLDPTAQGRSR